MRRISAFGVRLMFLAAAGIIALNAAILCLHYQPFGWIAVALALCRKLRPRWRISGTFGTADFAGWIDLARGRLLGSKGLILGRLGLMPPSTRAQALADLANPSVDSERACRQAIGAVFGGRWTGNGFIRVQDGVHALTVSPAGGGKTVGTIAPNLFAYDGNCVVVDPKGELHDLTAEHRKRCFGHQIIRLDPALLCGPGSHCLNPMDWIDQNSPMFIDRCRDLAGMIVVRTGLERELHFLDSAENMLAAFIAYVCATEGNKAARNLRGVRTLLASRELYNASLVKMQENEGFYGVLQQMGHSLSWHVDRELGSVMTTVQRQSNIFESPYIAAATARTSFDPRALRSGRMTIYLIIPTEYLAVWAAVQRVFLGTLLRLTTRGTPTETNPVLFVVDEAAHIGQMRVLEDAITLLRGAGIRIWLFFQSLDQLNKCFGERASTVLDNMATQQFFAINSYETAEYISKRIGDATIVNRSFNDNTGMSVPIDSIGQQQQAGNRSWGSGSSTSEQGQALLRPDEVLRLSPHTAVVFHRNLPPILAECIRYFSDPAFRRSGVTGRWGTGRMPGLGPRGLFFGFVALLLAALVTVGVGRMKTIKVRVPAGGWRPPSPYRQDGWQRQTPPSDPLPPYWLLPTDTYHLDPTY